MCARVKIAMSRASGCQLPRTSQTDEKQKKTKLQLLVIVRHTLKNKLMSLVVHHMHAREPECDRDRGSLDRTNADASISMTTNKSSNENGKMSQTVESALHLLSAAREVTDLLFCQVLLTFCVAPTAQPRYCEENRHQKSF